MHPTGLALRFVRPRFAAAESSNSLTRTLPAPKGLWREMALNDKLDPLAKAVDPLWKQIKVLFTEHNFLTIVCAFFVLLMTLSFYRMLKSISPALVGFVLLLLLAILVLHWTATRTEPAFLTPFINWLAPFFPSAPTPPPLHPKH